jgi:ubiquitin-protein ligase E3 C
MSVIRQPLNSIVSAEDNELEPSVQRLSRRQVASVSPRLGVLNNIPFAIPFDVRVAIFRSFIHNDRRKFGNDHMDFDAHNRRQRVTVRREKIAQDGFDHLRETNLKAHIQITFIDQFGNEE